jgi:hypothetical protein
VLLQARWLAALLFSLPMALGILFAGLSQQWGRCLAMAACIVVPFAVVGLFRFDRGKIHDHAA